MYFNHIKYILIDLKLFKIYLLLNKTVKYLIICVGSILAHENDLKHATLFTNNCI